MDRVTMSEIKAPRRVLRRLARAGRLTVTRHGHEVAVLVSPETYRQMTQPADREGWAPETKQARRRMTFDDLIAEVERLWEMIR